MGVSLNNIAQQVQVQTNKGSWQEIRQSVREAYAFIVKSIWFENKKMDVGELNGNFIVTFTNQTPAIDPVINQYYVDISSTYLDLPQECGIISVCYMTEQNINFVRTNAGSYSRLSRITAGVMGGRQLYYVDNMKMYFPRMVQPKDVMLRLALALDNIDVDAPLNVSPDIQKQIVDMVVAVWNPQVAQPNEKIR